MRVEYKKKLIRVRDMVDNENQWEDMEYSDNGDDGYDDSYADEEYSDDQGYEYEEDYDEESDYEPRKKSGGSPIIAVLLLLILLGAGGYFAYTKFAPADPSQSGAFEQQETAFGVPEGQPGGQPQNSDDNLADSFFAEAGGRTVVRC